VSPELQIHGGLLVPNTVAVSPWVSATGANQLDVLF